MPTFRMRRVPSYWLKEVLPLVIFDPSTLKWLYESAAACVCK